VQIPFGKDGIADMTASNIQPQLVWLTGANGLIGNYLVQTAPRVRENYFFNNSATSTAASGKASGEILSPARKIALLP
jgi:hypothetical protein